MEKLKHGKRLSDLPKVTQCIEAVATWNHQVKIYSRCLSPWGQAPRVSIMHNSILGWMSKH